MRVCVRACVCCVKLGDLDFASNPHFPLNQHFVPKRLKVYIRPAP